MLIVKKFGGSSVADTEKIFNVARRCLEDYEKGNDVVVVLSAMGKTTDGLIAKALSLIHILMPLPAAHPTKMLLQDRLWHCLYTHAQTGPCLKQAREKSLAELC